MSDVAVTWAKAQSCLTRSGRPDRSAKQVLVHMASYADAQGEAWALVSVLALEMEVDERTVERGRKALVAAGLLIKTGETKTYRGKLVPIYQLPLETGHASTVRRLQAERQAREAADHAAWGDTGVAPADRLGATRVSPVDDAGDTPRGDTGVAQIGKEIPQELTLQERERAGEASEAVGDPHRRAACAAWARKAPERVAPELVDAAWAEALTRSGWSSERMADAVSACVARDPDFERGKAVGLHRWLGERRYEPWDVARPEAATRSASAAARAAWAGPEEVRDAVRAVMGPGGVASYLDPAGWDGERGVVLARTGHAERQLRERAGRLLGEIGVSVERADG